MNEFLQNVVEVRTTRYNEQVNRWLKEGWKLIHVGTYSEFDDGHVEAGTEFTLARIQ